MVSSSLQQKLKAVEAVVAEKNGILTIPKNLPRARYRVRVQCALDHPPFSMTIYDLLLGHWCKECRSSYGERVARTLMERVFGVAFERKRPKWLIFPETNRPLELDGYNQELKIAFEHQGIHHFRELGLVGTRQVEVKKRDKFKARQCANLGVKLFIFREIGPRTTCSEVFAQLSREAARLGVFLPKEPTTLDEDVLSVSMIDRDIERTRTIRKVVESHGFTLSDKTIESHIAPVHIVCEKGHKLSLGADYISQGRWQGQCKVCLGYGATARDYERLGKKRGLRLAGLVPPNKQSVAQWTCKAGHSIEMSYKVLSRSKLGCSRCFGPRSILTKRLAKAGLDLKREYPGTRRFLIACTKCKGSFKRGYHYFSRDLRCPHCTVNGEYRDLGRNMQLLLRSTIPVSKTTPVKWECKHGHIQRASFATLKTRQYGCLECRSLAHYAAKTLRELDLPFELIKARNACIFFRCTRHDCTFTVSGIKHLTSESCPRCRIGVRRKRMTEYCGRLAAGCGFKFVGPVPRQVTQKTTWECAEGHRFRRTPSLLSSGHTQCKECARKLASDTRIATLNQLIKGTACRVVNRLSVSKFELLCARCEKTFTRFHSNIHASLTCPFCNQ